MPGSGGAPYNKYWLMGHQHDTSPDITQMDPLAADAFSSCLGNPRSTEPSSKLLGVKSVASVDGQIRWIYGSILGFIKQASELAGFDTALQWLQAWSRFLSVGINAHDFLNVLGITTKHFFRHIMVSL